MLTLWDLIKPGNKAKRHRDGGSVARPADPQHSESRRNGSTRRPVETMRQKYDRTTRECLAQYSVRVRKWRSSMSGCAWEVRYNDGRVSRLIEAPKPRGPMSAAVFLHEIGHHAIGFGRHRPRCLEEYLAWAWAIDEMTRRGLNVTPAVHNRMRDSMRYAVYKARKRGLKRIPDELAIYLDI